MTTPTLHRTSGEAAASVSPSEKQLRVFGTRVLWGLSALIIATAMVSSDGLYTIDEFVYAAAADSLSHGSLAVDNGFDTFGSDDLELLLLRAGPDGLVPQYPPGQAILGAPFIGFLGVRWLILLNALASAGTLFVTRALARNLFRSEKIALGGAVLLAVGTFWAEYAFGVWPHALAILGVSASMLFGLHALDADQRGALRFGLYSGLAAGAGTLVRLDSLLIVVALALVALLFGRHRWTALAAGAAGLIPGLAVLSFTNHLKFGTFVPLSYGLEEDTGNAALSSYIPAILLLGIVCTLVVLLWRLVRAGRLPGWSYAPAAALAAVAVLLVPSVREMAGDYVSGAWAILVDARAIDDPRDGVVRDGAVLMFWGIAKKSLGQSLPWLGLLLVLAARPLSDRRREVLTTALIVLGIWSLPSFLKAWHGGFGSNMRYLLPVLPLVCSLAAAAWYELLAYARATPRRVLAGAGAGVAIVLAWGASGPHQLAGAQQIASEALFLVTAFVCLLVAVLRKRRDVIARVAVVLVAAGFAVSAIFGALDTATNQATRYESARWGDDMSQLPQPSLFYGPPERFAFQIGRPDGIVGLPADGASGPDTDLVREALDAGYGVYARRPIAQQLAQTDGELVVGRTVSERAQMVEVRMKR